MKVKVKFFAILRERVGTGEIIKEIEDGTTVGELWEFLRLDYPKLPSIEIRLLYAVNRNYVKAERVLQEGDEVVFVPPVSGGLDYVLCHPKGA
ncbi:MAG: molybdopterin converting factor subunit 1 [Candidatus Binatia bacterium]